MSYRITLEESTPTFRTTATEPGEEPERTWKIREFAMSDDKATMAGMLRAIADRLDPAQHGTYTR